jgi:undecaprenyl-diphosphatase
LKGMTIKMSFDDTISQSIRNLSGKIPVLDSIAIAIIRYVPYIFILLVLAVMILGIFKKNRKMRIYAVSTAIFTGLNLLLAALISTIFYIPRPFIKFKFKPLLPHVDDSSFPSDHATETMSIATGFFGLNRIFGITLIICSIVIGFAKVYAGHHSVLDILASYVMVFVTRLVYNRLLAKRIKKLYLKIEGLIIRKK